MQTITRPSPRCARSVAAWRREGLRIGFVPTMGNLHAGPFLAGRAGAPARATSVVASIFVNPDPVRARTRTTRAIRARPSSDIAGLARRRLRCAVAADGRGDVSVRHHGLRADARAGHHRHPVTARTGPAISTAWRTVVARLFNMVQPDVAVFGRKDYQQLQVIRYMTREMSFPGARSSPAPTLREADGLAMSSRNQYLQGDERQTAAVASTGPCSFMRDQAALGPAARAASRPRPSNAWQGAGFDGRLRGNPPQPTCQRPQASERARPGGADRRAPGPHAADRQPRVRRRLSRRARTHTLQGNPCGLTHDWQALSTAGRTAGRHPAARS